ncbi:Disease resistance protein RUN1 [Linum grandiflorum]
MASSISARFTYQVFLSFRGQDTRKTFTDHLYTALTQSGITTFRDDNEIRRGENIQSEINHGIHQSNLSILVLSSDYASSRWCLDELALIMDRRKTHSHIVLPLYIDVHPSNVHSQTGSYGEAFAQHRIEFSNETLDRWRSALTQLSDIPYHMVLQDRYQSEFVQAVVNQVAKLLNRTILDVSTYLVGMDYRAGLINLWLDTDATIAAIYGVGGVGKTTIAKIIYNQNFENFDATSFLADISNISDQPNGLIRLQRQLLSDLTKGSAAKVYGVDEGIVKIRDALSRKRVLLVLDDVDQAEQLNAIMGLLEWFHPGSKILITTRNQHILGAHAVSFMLKVKELDDKESLQLFSWHAFGSDHPELGYELLSMDVVHHCGGIPLALQVLASTLYGKPKDIWESVLQRLKKVPESDIQSIFQITYASLEDDHDRNLFLDIACFFNGMDLNYVAKIADGCGFFTVVGVKNLMRRCLVSISDDNRLAMHQLLVDMGREIVRQESVDDPGQRSRLCDYKDSLMVLKEKKGTDIVKGLVLNLPLLNGSLSKSQPKDRNSSRKLMATHQRNVSKRQRLGFFDQEPEEITSEDLLSTQSVARMQNLKLLHLSGVRFKGNYKNFPKKLVWLRWNGFPVEYIPNEMYLENLVVLDLRNSNLKYLWKVKKFMPVLKILNLNHSRYLVTTPNFKGFPSLERLLLKDCASLVELDESLCELKGLELLNLQDCTSLKKLPTEFGMLKCSLSILILSGCFNLRQMPKDLNKMESLKVLLADRVGINQVANSSEASDALSLSSGTFNFWSWILQRRFMQSSALSFSIFPSSLVSLSLADCNISNLPISFGLIPSLQSLNLSKNPFHYLPEDINKLPMLETLELELCTELKALPELPTSLNILKADDCTSLNKVTNLPNLLEWLDLEIQGCEKLVEVEGLFKLEAVTSIDTEVLNQLGLFNREIFRGIEIEMSNAFSCTKMKTPIQVLQECNIFSTFIPGSEVLDWFDIRAEEPSSMSVLLPVSPCNRKIRGLSFCTVYTGKWDKDEENDESFLDENYAKISNQTSGLKWCYSPMFFGIPEARMGGSSMLWLSHWIFGECLEVGDELYIVMDLAACFNVIGCGARIIYEQQQQQQERSENSLNGTEIAESSNRYYKTMADVDLSGYEVGKDAFLLSHHKFLTHQGAPRDDWDDLSGYEYLFEPNSSESEYVTTDDDDDDGI